MKTCGECGLFCSCGALWPSGMCLPRGDRLGEADATACVCWEKDWRGVDQSDGVEEKDEGTVDPLARNKEPITGFPYPARAQFGLHFKQSELF